METTREELYKLIWKEPVTKVAEKMGVPAPILRKFCHRLNIPTPSSGYWSKLQFGKPVEIPPLPAFGFFSEAQEESNRKSPEGIS